MPLFHKKTKVIIDTNLWISFLISREYEKMDFLFSSGRICLLFSERLFAEFIRVVSREKFRKYFSESDINELSVKMKKVAKIVQTKSIQTQCRDSKDNFLLELAVDGKADYLITGDNDLLELKTVNKTKIVKMNDFFAIRSYIG
jgi:putative PIN family toxin of toxin-antitoxin system